MSTNTVSIIDNIGNSINLPFNDPLYIGRGGILNIPNTAAIVSRKHIKLVLKQQQNNPIVELTVLSINPINVIINNIKSILSQSDTAELTVNDSFIINLSLTEYRLYTIKYNTIEPAVIPTATVNKRSVSPFPELPNNNTNTAITTTTDDLELPAPSRNNQSKRSRIDTNDNNNINIVSTTATATAAVETPMANNIDNNIIQQQQSINIQSTDAITNSTTIDPSIGQYSIAFPLLSIGDLQFDPILGIEIMFQSVQSILNQYSNSAIKLILVLPNNIRTNSSILVDSIHSITNQQLIENIKLNQTKYITNTANQSRFIIYYGTITTLLTESNHPAHYIVNSSDWLFSSNGVNRKLIHTIFNQNLSVNQSLQLLSQQLYKTAKLATAYPIKVPIESELYQQQLVHYIIHIVPPNYNPMRPDSLSTDNNSMLDKGAELLRQSYINIFKCFYQLTELPAPIIINNKLNNKPQSFADIIAEHSNNTIDLSNENNNNNLNQSIIPIYKPPSTNSNYIVNTTNTNWSNALLQYIQSSDKRPPELSNDIYYEDSDLVCIYDKYPKSKYHLLLIPKQIKIDSINELNSNHIKLIELLQSKAEWIKNCLITSNNNNSNNNNSINIRTGFHLIPSLKQLHLHIISQDFNSSWLKNKKHWNSFNTEFFRPIAIILELLKTTGIAVNQSLLLQSDRLLTKSLHCHHRGCDVEIKTIPQLKQHIGKCKKPQPTD